MYNWVQLEDQQQLETTKQQLLQVVNQIESNQLRPKKGERGSQASAKLGQFNKLRRAMP